MRSTASPASPASRAISRLRSSVSRPRESPVNELTRTDVREGLTIAALVSPSSSASSQRAVPPGCRPFGVGTREVQERRSCIRHVPARTWARTARGPQPLPEPRPLRRCWRPTSHSGHTRARSWSPSQHLLAGRAVDLDPRGGEAQWPLVTRPTSSHSRAARSSSSACRGGTTSSGIPKGALVLSSGLPMCAERRRALGGGRGEPLNRIGIARRVGVVREAREVALRVVSAGERFECSAM